MPAPITLSWDPDLSRAEVLSLYDAVGWSAYTEDPVALMRGLAGSHGVLAAREGGHSLVGLARTISDGVAVVYVQDLLVHPQFQRRGIGRALMAELQQWYADCPFFVLSTDAAESTEGATSHPFYRATGLVPHEEQGLVAFARPLSR